MNLRASGFVAARPNAMLRIVQDMFEKYNRYCTVIGRSHLAHILVGKDLPATSVPPRRRGDLCGLSRHSLRSTQPAGLPPTVPSRSSKRGSSSMVVVLLMRMRGHSKRSSKPCQLP